MKNIPILLSVSGTLNCCGRPSLAEKYSAENRKLEVTYLYGASGVGKTWGIFEQHDPWEICRITNYRGAKGHLL